MTLDLFSWLEIDCNGYKPYKFEVYTKYNNIHEVDALQFFQQRYEIERNAIELWNWI